MTELRPALSRLGRTARGGVRALCSPAGLRGAGTEALWSLAHLALYPMGVLAERDARTDEGGRLTVDDLPPLQRGLLLGDVTAAGTPIVLVHGLVDNRSVFTVLRRALRRRGFGRVLTLNYSPFTSDVAAAAAQLAALVEKTCEATGHERVHVVGHSLGGVVARYYVQVMGGDQRVHTLCTLGSPHSGTWAAHLLPSRLVRQLRPGSELLAALAAPAPGCRTRFVAFWSDLDQLIVPKQSARVDHPDLRARNVLLRGVGHMSLPIDGRVVHSIATLLAHLDEDGSTRTAGVSSLGGSAPSTAGAASPDRPSLTRSAPSA
ncbi:MAG: putative secreted lipase [uncultured Frankineae bacterium]|uniref:Putative secreted lipase n=1 Tax=uncultured Frankineae bacterium TaxID=437475 RepID=A0A6J4KWA8_9ACTN|nr:MAG: putative secreted lipase [uncultured Frankineae bacterium]